jgi:hypothetical protein
MQLLIDPTARGGEQDMIEHGRAAGYRCRAADVEVFTCHGAFLIGLG